MAPPPRGRPWRARLLAGVPAAVCGLANLVLGGAHLGTVVARAARGQGFDGAAGFTYDFLFYSLVMLGLLLVVPALVCLGGAVKLLGGRAGGGKLVFWSGVVLVVVNAPLIGRNPFALLLAAAAAAALLALAATRRSLG